MAEAYATVDDYRRRVRVTLDQAGIEQVHALLEDASAILRSKLPSGWSPDAGIARTLAITMVQRRITNPGGRRSRQVGQTSESYDQDGGLYVTDAEVDQLLAGYVGEGASGAYTVGMRDEAYPPRTYGCNRVW